MLIYNMCESLYAHAFAARVSNAKSPSPFLKRLFGCVGIKTAASSSSTS